MDIMDTTTTARPVAGQAQSTIVSSSSSEYSITPSELRDANYGGVTPCVFSVGGRSVETFRDDLTGQPLNADLVRAARKIEMDYFRSKEVWRKKPIS